MNNFSDRQKAYEDKFAHDEELMFKARVRGAKLLGQWVAEKVGLPAEAYAAELVNLVTGGQDEDDLVAKIITDASNKGQVLTKDLVLEKLNKCLAQAKEQIANS